ncbi:hypothetical protein PPERSA_04004 [Pseudocohnilembus persalinus]|uniref:CCAAT-binding factor domain-containing protein n=1 Tax=Pseudocohnilembus persalinus TaxID=266149 RepID=A0A0V0QL15_PSEPJ|nr:hypothetical protein PPERSA_04004 [Pseudocohnilembus persalinus]|eukprot:KRX02801.1 hypothetical protein PPERSA_04004 [Pseudocohnilembus persalinus]
MRSQYNIQKPAYFQLSNSGYLQKIQDSLKTTKQVQLQNLIGIAFDGSESKPPKYKQRIENYKENKQKVQIQYKTKQSLKKAKKEMDGFFHNLKKNKNDSSKKDDDHNQDDSDQNLEDDDEEINTEFDLPNKFVTQIKENTRFDELSIEDFQLFWKHYANHKKIKFQQNLLNELVKQVWEKSQKQDQYQKESQIEQQKQYHCVLDFEEEKQLEKIQQLKQKEQETLKIQQKTQQNQLLSDYSLSPLRSQEAAYNFKQQLNKMTIEQKRKQSNISNISQTQQQNSSYSNILNQSNNYNNISIDKKEYENNSKIAGIFKDLYDDEINNQNKEIQEQYYFLKDIQEEQKSSPFPFKYHYSRHKKNKSNSSSFDAVEAEKEMYIGLLRKVFKALILGKKLVQFKSFDSFNIVASQDENQDENKRKNKKKNSEDQQNTEQSNQQDHIKRPPKEIQEFISQKFQAFTSYLLFLAFKPELNDKFRELALKNLIEVSRYHFQNVDSLHGQGINENILLDQGEQQQKKFQSVDIILQQICDKLVQGYTESDAGEVTIVILEYGQQFYDFTYFYMLGLQKSIMKQFKNIKQMEKEEFLTEQIILTENNTSIMVDFPDFINMDLKNTFYVQKASLQSNKNLNNFKQSEELKILLKKRKNNAIKTDQERKKESEIEKQDKILDSLKSYFSNLIFEIIKSLKGNQEAEKMFSNIIVKNVLNNMQNPLIISDYCTESFDNAKDCNLQVQNLSAILVLIGKYGLEYPNYYHKLYRLIGNPQIFKCDYKAKFMKMVETSLKSSKVPLTVQASFIKKFLQISLQQSPNVILWILSIIINTIKRNPTLTKMIDTRDLKMGVKECFDRTENDIYNTNAENSYVWEVKSLQNHYLNEVNKLIDVMGSNLQVTNFLETEPFSDLVYTDLISLSIQTSLKQKSAYKVKTNTAGTGNLNILNLEYFE